MWLSFINPGMLVGSNIDLFAYCINRLPNNTGAVIEIGSFAGLSLNHLILLLKKRNAETRFFQLRSGFLRAQTSDIASPEPRLHLMIIGALRLKRSARTLCCSTVIACLIISN
jgi:hypothetical protein